MRLVSFSIRNYRSITKAHKIRLGRTTVLVGKNNEGKSNILRALAIGMTLIKNHARGVIGIRARRLLNFDWEADFPIGLQKSGKSASCKLRLEFSLSESELQEFSSEIKSKLNGTLPIEIEIFKDASPTFKVAKQGPGATALSKKSSRIAQFIGSRIDLNYIPAVRTESASVQVVTDMVQQKLYELERHPEYQKALDMIANIQAPVLKEISEQILTPLQGFLPQVKSVDVTIPEEIRRQALRRCDIIINDGTPTSIRRKGDGVKSLAAISLLQGDSSRPQASVLALEEPESHLHPGAIHQLRSVVDDLSKNHQVVITSHHPLFIDRINVSSNIIVESNLARQAKSMAEIRDTLGVRPSDEFMNARLVLLVEGGYDKAAMTALVLERSSILARHLMDGSLLIDSLNGGANLAYKSSLVKSMLCVVHALMDNDEEGIRATQRCVDQGILKVADFHLTICKGLRESEFEDCLDPALYEHAISENFGVSLHCDEFRKSNAKWSERLKSCFYAQGKPWSPQIEDELKGTVSRIVVENASLALVARGTAPIESLFQCLVQKIEAMHQARPN